MNQFHLWWIAFKLTKYTALRHPSWHRLNPHIPDDLMFDKCYKTLGLTAQHQSLFVLTDEYTTNGQFNIDHGGTLHISDDSIVNENNSSRSLDSNWYSQLTIEANVNPLHSHYPQNSPSHYCSVSPLHQDDYSMSTPVPPAMLPSTLPAFSPAELNLTMPTTDPQEFSPLTLDSSLHTPVLPDSSSTDIVLSMPVPPSVPVTPSPSVASESGSQLTCIDPSLLNIATPAQAMTSTITRTQGHNSMSLDGAPQPQGLFLMVPFYPY
ncbi:hypothetical protein BD769DRAFT_1675394 [Suillus cothurnatus]|nr:hypothetical protein BD769DRAFT_1675394 [Suillus cothurnatus]